MDGCIGSTHWKACYSCRNNDMQYGCLIKEKISLSIHKGNWLLCGDYEYKPFGVEWEKEVMKFSKKELVGMLRCLYQKE